MQGINTLSRGENLKFGVDVSHYKGHSLEVNVVY